LKYLLIVRVSVTNIQTIVAIYTLLWQKSFEQAKELGYRGNFLRTTLHLQVLDIYFGVGGYIQSHNK